MLDLRPLYHAPLAEFVAARAALAKHLRQAKDPRVAEIRTLRKPTLSAWAVNQLFAHESKAIAALIAAGERARAAQIDAAEGGEAEPLRDLLLDIRRQTVRLTERATAHLTAADRAPGEAIVERIRHNLDALALDPATAPVAERGWLDEDLEPPGFEIVAALQLAAAGGSRPAKRSAPAPLPAARKATVDHLDDRRKAIAERKERERRERLERLRADLSQAEAVAAEERATADEASEEADAATQELAAAEERAAAADARATEARHRAEEADAATARARELLEQAERES